VNPFYCFINQTVEASRVFVHYPYL